MKQCKICGKEIEFRRTVCSKDCNMELTRQRNIQRNKSRGGKTYEELYGIEKSNEMKEKRRMNWSGENNINFGGLKESTKQKLSQWRTGKTYEEIYGVSDGHHMRIVRKKQLTGTKRPMKEETKEKLRKAHTDVTWEEKYGNKKAIKLKKIYMARFILDNPYLKNPNHSANVIARNKSRGGKTYEELYGIEKANEIKDKKSEYWIGINNPNWNGGISGEKYPLLFHTKRFKKSIRDCFNNVCVICKKTKEENGREMCIHHIDYNKKNLNLNNLVILCDTHHGQTQIDRKMWKEKLEQINKEKLDLIKSKFNL